MGPYMGRMRLSLVVALGLAAACFILLATKIRGATGAPVRPIVIV